MINFPNTPTIGDVYYAPSSGVSYRWDGTLWLGYPSAGPGYGPSGDFCANIYQGGTATPTALSLLTTMPVTSGNAGNWYNPATGRYQPPPGRYYIMGTTCIYATTSAVHHDLYLKKNGAYVLYAGDTIGANAWYTDPQVAGVFDCNGSDYFELWACSRGASGTWQNITFLAFPISGAKGPPGDKGAPGVTGGQLLAEQVATVNTAAFNLTNLGGAKTVEIGFVMMSSAADDGIRMRVLSGGTPLGSGYAMRRTYISSASAPGGDANSLAYFDLGAGNANTATYPTMGKISIMNMGAPLGLRAMAQYWYTGPTTNYTFNASFNGPVGDGIQLYWGTGQIAPNSLARAIGWT